MACKGLRPILAAARRPAMMNVMLRPSRTLTSKTFREHVEKPKPFPHETREFNLLWSFFAWDKATWRFDENTKVILVQGAHAIGKSQLAQELADQFEMKYFPPVNFNELYVSPDGKVDVRDYKDYCLGKVKPYDEKDFIRNPLGPIPDCADRFFYLQYFLKYKNYCDALRHVFNTGQGVVLEDAPFNHYVYTDAAYAAGWVQPSSKQCYKIMYDDSLHYLLRPNLIVYLDAPAEKALHNIAGRGNEWDKNSPVWTSNHLNDLYTRQKKDYLKNAQKVSQVLVYDWSEPGETELVVEDIERLNFDNYGRYDEQQRDWRLHDEMNVTAHRIRYSQRHHRAVMYSSFVEACIAMAPQLSLTPEETLNWQKICSVMKNQEYEPGFNPYNGDNVWFKWNTYKEDMTAWNYYFSKEVLRTVAVQDQSKIEP